jgi:hypothetical protein
VPKRAVVVLWLWGAHAAPGQSTSAEGAYKAANPAFLAAEPISWLDAPGIYSTRWETGSDSRRGRPASRPLPARLGQWPTGRFCVNETELAV